MANLWLCFDPLDSPKVASIAAAGYLVEIYRYCIIDAIDSR
jgi:hypothetical protein